MAWVKSGEQRMRIRKMDDIEWLRDTLGHAERQRDHWKRLCNEAEEQRDKWRALCASAERQRDDLNQYVNEIHGHGSFRGIEFNLAFSGINACIDSVAQLAMRERVLLYGLIFSVGPQRVLEIGTAEGGSALIISQALDDLHLGASLVTVDPFPDQLTIEWGGIKHNTSRVNGYFPRDFNASSIQEPFDFVFVDGDHSYQGVLDDLRYLPEIIAAETHILLHDAFNAEVARGIQQAVDEVAYTDCGIVGRVVNDSLGSEHFGGLRLLLHR